jgi:hypothetical protein
LNIELFFKWIKQQLEIKSFKGLTENTIIACMDSGFAHVCIHCNEVIYASAITQQNVLCADAVRGISFCGSGFTAFRRSGNLIGSCIKNTGILFPTKS